jgi:hypothetical protein
MNMQDVVDFDTGKPATETSKAERAPLIAKK